MQFQRLLNYLLLLLLLLLELINSLSANVILRECLGDLTAWILQCETWQFMGCLLFEGQSCMHLSTSAPVTYYFLTSNWWNTDGLNMRFAFCFLTLLRYHTVTLPKFSDQLPTQRKVDVDPSGPTYMGVSLFKSENCLSISRTAKNGAVFHFF